MKKYSFSTQRDSEKQHDSHQEPSLIIE